MSVREIVAAVSASMLTALGGAYSEHLQHEEDQGQLELAADALEHMREVNRMTHEGWKARCAP